MVSSFGQENLLHHLEGPVTGGKQFWTIPNFFSSRRRRRSCLFVSEVTILSNPETLLITVHLLKVDKNNTRGVYWNGMRVSRGILGPVGTSFEVGLG